MDNPHPNFAGKDLAVLVDNKSTMLQQSTMKRIKVLEAKKAGNVQPGEEKAQRDLISVYKYLMGGSGLKRRGGRLFPVLLSEQTSGHGCKLK